MAGFMADTINTKTLVIEPEMLDVIAELDEFKGAWRTLTTLLLLRAGYAYAPYGSLESIIEQSKDSCYLALRRKQRTTRSKTPDWQP